MTYADEINIDSLVRSGDSDKIFTTIENFLELSADYLNTNLDSAMYFAEQANYLFDNIESDSTKTSVYIHLGQVYAARGNYALSMDYLLRANKIVEIELKENPENYRALKFKGEIYSNIGVGYFYQGNSTKAQEYFEDAIEIFDINKRIKPESFDNVVQTKIFNNLAAIYIRQKNYDRAIEYYKTTLTLMNEVEDQIVLSSILNNLGICYMEKFEFESAFHYFQKALEIRKKSEDKRGIAQCYNNIGKNYFYQNNFKKGEEFILKAYNLGKEIGNKESVRISLQSLTSIYDSTHRYREAFIMSKELQAINDSLFNIESLARISQLEMELEFEQQRKIFDLELERREAVQEKKNLIYLIIGGALFFSLLTAILLIILQRNKIRHGKLEKEHLELESKHLNLEKEKLKEELDFKNRELTTNVMYLLKKNELITNISEKLIKSKLDFKKENQRIIQDIIIELRSSQDKDTWEEFEAHFTSVHTDFYKTINDRFPNLSSNEKKLCAFLRLNMSTKDIAAITYQSKKSIDVARFRLRKKLNIVGEDTNLIHFLSQF